MIRDITIGQFFPVDSMVHKLDPRLKILLVIVFIIELFIVSKILSLLIIMGLILLAYKISKISLKMVTKNIKSIWFIVIFTTIINVFFTKGDVLYHFGFISISKEGLFLSIVLFIRIIDMILISSLLTYTTSPIDLTHALESLFKPLSLIKVPVADISLMMTISLRFIPTLIAETDKIIMAQKSRGAKIDVGNVFQKLKSFIPVIIPLFISAFRSADELAIAMECRCYNSGIGKTSMNQLKFHKNDLIIASFCFVFFIVTLFIDHFYIN